MALLALRIEVVAMVIVTYWTPRGIYLVVTGDKLVIEEDDIYKGTEDEANSQVSWRRRAIMDR